MKHPVNTGRVPCEHGHYSNVGSSSNYQYTTYSELEFTLSKTEHDSAKQRNEAHVTMSGYSPLEMPTVLPVYSTVDYEKKRKGRRKAKGVGKNSTQQT